MALCCHRRTSGRVPLQQGLDRLRGIVMEPITLLSGGCTLGYALPVCLIVCQRDAPEVWQQIVLAVRDEQDLIDPKAPDGRVDACPLTRRSCCRMRLKHGSSRRLSGGRPATS